MQAIVTKFLSPTNTRGARIKATAAAGSVTVSYDYEGDDAAHMKACLALVAKLGWQAHAGQWHMGGLPTGERVFVAVSAASSCRSARCAPIDLSNDTEAGVRQELTRAARLTPPVHSSDILNGL